MYEVREIKTNELPDITDLITGEVRKPTLQEQMNLGFFHLQDDVYHVIGAWADGRGQRKNNHDVPGRRLSKGLGTSRERELPKDTKLKLKESKRMEATRRGEPQPPQPVEADELPVMRFSGEPQ